MRLGLSFQVSDLLSNFCGETGRPDPSLCIPGQRQQSDSLFCPPEATTELSSEQMV